jgi:predicted DNA-binding transcriptional regulator AlpA
MSAKCSLLNSEAAGEYIGIGPRTLPVWRNLGKGPKYLKIGGKVLYRREDLDAWLTSRLVDPEAPFQGAQE